MTGWATSPELAVATGCWGHGEPALAVDNQNKLFVFCTTGLFKRTGPDTWQLLANNLAIDSADDLIIHEGVPYWIGFQIPDGGTNLETSIGIIEPSSDGESANIAAGPGGALVAVWREETPNNDYRLYLSTYPLEGIPTKRYYAGDRQLAMRLDNELYYTLPDPTGLSLTLAQADGTAAGYLVYDAYGKTLSSTLSSDLETALAGQDALPDPDTNLVYLGGGRFYDPALGRPLQPNPVGGPPTVPQALNRYGATSLGPPGVAEGAANMPSFTNLSLTTGFVKSVAFETLARTTYGSFGRSFVINSAYEFVSMELSIQVSLTAFTRARRQIVAAGGTLISEPVDVFIEGRRFVRGLFRIDNFEAAGKLPDILGKLPKRAPWRALVTGSSNLRIATETGVEPRLSILKHPLIGFGTDALLGFGFQYYEDSYNPYFRWDQRLVRASVSGAGGAGTALLFVSLACGPEAPACALALSGLGGLSWAYIAQPTIFESIPYLQPPPRNLQPFD